MNKTQEALKMAIEALKIAEQIEGYGLISFKKYGFKEDGDILKKYRQTLDSCKEALAELAMEQMAQNAREIDLVYCKHGSDGFCKECAMEQTK